MSTALEAHPDDVQAYFIGGGNSIVNTMYTTLTRLQSADNSQQSNLTSAKAALGDQITTMQSRIDNERQTLTNSFIQMLDAQSAADSQNKALTNAFFKNSSG